MIRYPDDPSLRSLLKDLRRLDRFVRYWDEATMVEHKAESKTFVHALVGTVTMDCDVFTAVGSDIRIVSYTVEAGTEDASRFDLIRTVGTSDLAARPD